MTATLQTLLDIGVEIHKWNTPGFELVQDGIVVAEAWGYGAENEILHYASIYLQDGPITIRAAGKKKPAPTE